MIPTKILLIYYIIKILTKCMLGENRVYCELPILFIQTFSIGFYVL